MNIGYTAFLIDDDDDDHLFFELATEGIGAAIQCEFASDGFVGVERLQDPKFNPDIIFIDINMPRMNGVECLTVIKKMTRYQKIPVYMYSTSADPEIVNQCIKLGAKDLVKKLPNIEQMRERFKKIFSEVRLSASNGK